MYGVASLIVTAIVLPFIGSILVGLRFLVRLQIKPSYVGIDDWVILFACILVWAQGANQVVAAFIGELGRDNEKTVQWRVDNEKQIDYATQLIEKVTYSLIKLSVLFFYRRIFIQMKRFRITNNTLIVLVALWGIVYLFTDAFLCKADSVRGRTCPPQEWASLWFAITDVLTDMAILILPYPCIRKLQMRRRDKIGLSAIFLLGTLALVFGIVRLGFVAKTFSSYFHPSDDGTSPQRTPPSFWTTAEVSVGLSAACLPPLGPLIRRTPSLKDHVPALHKWREGRRGRFPTRLSSDEDMSRINRSGGKEIVTKIGGRKDGYNTRSLREDSLTQDEHSVELV